MMMPVIRISDESWERLKRWAEPLEDGIDDAFRKVLTAAEEYERNHETRSVKPIVNVEKNRTKHSGRLKRGEKTPQSTYRIPILETISELGGSARMDEVLKVVEKKLKNTLKDVDYQNLPSGGDIRWRNTAQWERLVLVKDGLLKSNSPTGYWEISEQGLKEINQR